MEQKMQHILPGVSVTMLNAVQNDERGQTYEFWKGEPSRQITYCRRNPFTIAGNHYHRGEDASKNPERFVLLPGKAFLAVFDGATLEIPLLESTPASLLEISIASFIVHAIVPLETRATFLEYRPTVFNKNESDTYAASAFPNDVRIRGTSFDENAFAHYQNFLKNFQNAKSIATPYIGGREA